MKKELPKKYNPAEHEAQIYSMWEESGAFSPPEPPSDKNDEKTFSVLMPPPNANGSLHVGHAVGVTLEDLMVRYHRMKGESTVWIPGLDHAGFETQIVFEKKLEKEGKNRFEMEPDDLYSQTLEFTRDNGEKIIEQLKRLGASADWSRQFFTLDEEIVTKVYETFVKLYEDELAYRDLRPVHWCPKHQTTLSDLQVNDKVQTDPLYFIKYGPLTLATVRPETKFGDTALAVNPNDDRYKKYVGQELEIETVLGPTKIKVIADEMVDPEFGTGVVKITPAHDPNDFEVAKRHDLPIVEVIDARGRMNEKAGPYKSMKVLEAREKMVKKLTELGLIDKIDEKYSHSIKVCYKCSCTIEPRLLTQWFIDVNKKGKVTGKSLAPDAAKAVTEGETKFVTDRFQKTFDHWMSIIRDWPISRQIVWGIRLPVWYCKCGGTTVKVPSQTEIIFARHGEAKHNELKIGNGDPAKDYPLTKNGKAQTAKLIDQFKKDNIDFDAIIASQMPRVQETAQLVAKELDGNVITDKRLNDIWLGGLEGQDISQLHKVTDYHEKSVKESETFSEVTTRVESFLRDLSHEHASKKRILVVTSEIIFWALRKALNPELDPNEMMKHVKNSEFKKFSLGDFTPCSKCGGLDVERDKDVFDTWFSSGQLPVIVPQSRTNHPTDFERFYPTSVMETGWDILFFWVARMMMFGKYLTDKVPFKHVFLHGLVRDKDRQKMSKSKGNVLDPLAVVDEYGTDALRMALVFGTKAGNDMPMSEEKVRGMRNFANKLWNVSRFIFMNLEDTEASGNWKAESDSDKLILEKLEKTITDTTRHFEDFRFHEGAQGLYQFLWSDLADTYIEASKDILFGENKEAKSNTLGLLVHVLSTTLKLLHPIMPFITEVIWQQLPEETKDSEHLINAPWPKKN